MSWDFTIRDLGVCGGRSALGQTNIERSTILSRYTSTRLPPPWVSLEGFAEANDGRQYAWEIYTFDAWRDLSSWEKSARMESTAGEKGMLLATRISQLGRGIIAVEGDFPFLLTETPDFDDEASGCSGPSAGATPAAGLRADADRRRERVAHITRRC
jgi:hypothetical protein